MKAAELGKQLRERRKATRALVAARRKASRARVDANPTVRRARERRRRNRLLTLMTVLLALLLVNRCECQEAVLPPVAAPVPVPPAPPPPAPKVTTKPRPKVTTKIRQGAETKARPAFEADRRPSPTWLDDFRLQVAARSTRLSSCFDGSERPGALRWTASVNAGSGAASDHLLEPMGTGSGLSEKQRECVVGVLSSPAYRLGAQEQALPERVSIAVEF